MTTYTTDQALTNWRNAFDSGHLTAARAWWAIVQRSLTAIPDGMPDDDYSDVGPERSPLARWREQGAAEQARIAALPGITWTGKGVAW